MEEEEAIRKENSLTVVQFLTEVARQLTLYRKVYENPTTWLSAKQLGHIKSWLPRLRRIGMDGSAKVNIREVAVRLGHAVRKTLADHHLGLDELWVPPEVGAIEAAVKLATSSPSHVSVPGGGPGGAAGPGGGAAGPGGGSSGSFGADPSSGGGSFGLLSGTTMYSDAALSTAGAATSGGGGGGGAAVRLGGGGGPVSLVQQFGGDNHSTRLLKVCKMIQRVDGAGDAEVASRAVVENWQSYVSVVPPRASYHRPR